MEGTVEEFSGDGGGGGVRREDVAPLEGEEAWMSESTPWRGARAVFEEAGDEENYEWMREREVGRICVRNEEVEVVAWCVALVLSEGSWEGCYEYLS